MSAPIRILVYVYCIKAVPTETQMLRQVTRKRAQLAETLYELRLQNDFSQARLAKVAGVDRKTINRIENGHFSPALDTIVRLSCALRVKPDALLKG